MGTALLMSFEPFVFDCHTFCITSAGAVAYHQLTPQVLSSVLFEKPTVCSLGRPQSSYHRSRHDNIFFLRVCQPLLFFSCSWGGVRSVICSSSDADNCP